MKRKQKKLCASLLAAAVFLGACAPPSPSGPYPLPDAFLAEEAEETALLENEARVHFFIDNTQSMAGFVQNSAGEFGKPDAVMHGLIVALRRQCQNFDAVLHLVGWPSESSYELNWVQADRAELDRYDQEDFYTFDQYQNGRISRYGYFKDGSGPLNEIYNHQLLDQDAVNLVLTDLEEQNLNNTTLATTIRNSILSDNRHSVCLIALRAAFSGSVYVPSRTQSNEMEASAMNDGTRPIYLIMTGPDRRLTHFANQFRQALQDQNLVEGTHYQMSLYRPNLGVERVGFGEIETSSAGAFSEKIPEEAWQGKQVHLNLNAKESDLMKASELYGLEREQDVFFYEYVRGDTNTKRFLLHFFIPLRLEEDVLHYENRAEDLRHVTYFVPGEASSGETAAQKAYPDWESIRCWALSQGATQGSSGKEERVYQWEAVPQGLSTKNLFSVSTRRVAQGESVLDFGTEIEGYQRQELIRAQNGMDYIHVTVEAPVQQVKMPGTAMLLRIPVYAAYETPISEPKWVGDYHRGLEDGETLTTDFRPFYRYLFGIQSNLEKEELTAMSYRKIATLRIAVSGFPAAGGSGLFHFQGGENK